VCLRAPVLESWCLSLEMAIWLQQCVAIILYKTIVVVRPGPGVLGNDSTGARPKTGARAAVQPAGARVSARRRRGERRTTRTPAREAVRSSRAAKWQRNINRGRYVAMACWCRKNHSPHSPSARARVSHAAEQQHRAVHRRIDCAGAGHGWRPRFCGSPRV
jgi:hypothetical protein